MNLQNTREYIECFLMIRTKSGRIVPLRLNRAQRRLYDTITKLYKEGKPIRIIILKARQLGFSTFVEAVIFKRTATAPNVNSLVVAHREDSTAALFRMNKLFYDYLPDPVKPMISASNAQELVFENPEKNPVKRAKNPGLNSRIRCNTAGGSGVGRGDTFQNIHASEFGFWRGNILDTWSGIIQTLPSEPGTLAIIESTANGFNAFKDVWDKAVAGQNDFVPLFFAWYDNPDYVMPVPPETQWTEAEIEMQVRYELSDEQLQWRRWCIRNNCAGEERRFRQEYPSNPDEAFLTSGDGVFDNEVVMRMREQAPKPLHVGEFEYDYDEVSITNIRWVDKPNGCIRIYKDPQKRRPYVLGGDTAGEGSDNFTGFVIDNISGRHCAVLKRQFDEAAYSRQMYCLGAHFNFALLGLETNFSTYPVMELSRLRYPNLYVRMRSDTFTGQIKQSFGFRTDSLTRPVIIAGLVEMFNNHPDYFVDYEMLGEMLTFIRSENGKPEAIVGKHDDLVMAAAITYGIRTQQRVTESKVAYSMDGWSEDMKEDYRRASEEEKAYLRKAWGKKEEQDE